LEARPARLPHASLHVNHAALMHCAFLPQRRSHERPRSVPAIHLHRAWLAPRQRQRHVALEGALSWLVLLSLPFFRRAFLAPHMTVANTDIAIVQGSLGANIMGMISLGLSTSKIPYIAAISVYTSGSGLADSLRTYATLGLSPMEQVSDLYVRFSLTETLAGLLGPPLWTGLFGSVLKGGYLPVGLPFWICAAVFAGALTLTWSIKRLEDDLWMGLMSKLFRSGVRA